MMLFGKMKNSQVRLGNEGFAGAIRKKHEGDAHSQCTFARRCDARIRSSADCRSNCESEFDGILPSDVATAVQSLGLINSVNVDVNSVF